VNIFGFLQSKASKEAGNMCAVGPAQGGACRREKKGRRTNVRKKKKNEKKKKLDFGDSHPTKEKCQQHRESKASRSTAVALRWLGRDGALINGGRSRLLLEQFQGVLGSVFFGIVDILAIVPVSRGDSLAVDGDGAGPGGTTS
jgi:hypothetical protein